MRSCGAYSHECLENEEADHDGLDEKENRIELVITFVLSDSGRQHASEIERVADNIWFS